MIQIEVKMNGNAYKLPEALSENTNPLLKVCYKAILHFFSPIFNAYPNEDIIVKWDDDNKELECISDSLKQEQITKILIPHKTILPNQAQPNIPNGQNLLMT
jgi:hypothetical protein